MREYGESCNEERESVEYKKEDMYTNDNLQTKLERIARMLHISVAEVSVSRTLRALPQIRKCSIVRWLWKLVQAIG